jgi:hypothetical protein
MRVLHAPVNVGNQPWTLSRQERALGLESDLVVNYSTWLNYPADKVVGTHGGKTPREKLRRFSAGILAPLRYDVLHYYFGRSLLYWDDYGPENRFPFLDLKLAKKLGRRIVFTLQGCDARLAGESNRRNAVTMCRPDGCSAYATCLAQLDAERRHLINDILPLADRVFFLNPELGHYVPRGEFMPYANVAVEAIMPEPPSARTRPKILHAPSNDAIKGSPLIEAALAELAKRYDFEYVAVRNLPHDEAMRLYRDADLVIDQVLAGWYGGFAVELMSMGKPVVCYIRDEDLGFLPPAMRAALPILRVDPRRLAGDLETILARRAEWAAVGAAARRYVLAWHNPRHIAAALLRIYRDKDRPFTLDAAPEASAA